MPRSPELGRIARAFLETAAAGGRVADPPGGAPSEVTGTVGILHRHGYLDDRGAITDTGRAALAAVREREEEAARRARVERSRVEALGPLRARLDETGSALDAAGDYLGRLAAWDDRRMVMEELAARGVSMAQIGEWAGLSRQRVSAILKAARESVLSD